VDVVCPIFRKNSRPRTFLPCHLNWFNINWIIWTNLGAVRIRFGTIGTGPVKTPTRYLDSRNGLLVRLIELSFTGHQGPNTGQLGLNRVQTGLALATFLRASASNPKADFRLTSQRVLLRFSRVIRQDVDGAGHRSLISLGWATATRGV